ncbi:MAG: TonB family protein [Bacteroidales bacterium]
MNKIDLTSKDWCNLVFESKNKNYGGYVLRNESVKRHNKATLIIVVVALIVFTVPMLLKMVLPEKEKLKVTEVTALSSLPQAEEKQKELQPKVEVIPPPPLKSSIKFTPPVIKKDAEVRDEEEIKAQQELNTSKAGISIADVKGTDEVNGVDIAEVKDVGNETQETQKPYQIVEQMPTFPGGEEKLMEYLSKSIKYPAVAMENGIQGRVIIRFVVSPTGEITNAEVLRGVDPSCDKEALRVVNAMPRWIPGKQNGTSVPVYFTLPIVFRLQ